MSAAGITSIENDVALWIVGASAGLVVVCNRSDVALSMDIVDKGGPLRRLDRRGLVAGVGEHDLTTFEVIRAVMLDDSPCVLHELRGRSRLQSHARP